jgi:hypothetical protein
MIINCYDCGYTPVSDEARECPNCHGPVAEKTQAIKEKRRIELEEAERQRQLQVTTTANRRFNGILTVIVALFVLFVGFQIAKSQPLFSLDNQTASLAPNTKTFSVGGNLDIKISCDFASDSASIDVEIIDKKSQQSAWKGSLACPNTKTETVQIKKSTYTLAATLHGEAQWQLSITQAS